MNAARAILPAARVPRVLQRACACGRPAKDGGECEECKRKRAPALQRHATPGAGFTADFSATATSGRDGVPSAANPPPRLPVNEPGDAFEREADAMADAVLRGKPTTANPAPRSLARREAAPAANGLAFAPPLVHEVLQSPGAPLDAATSDELGSRFGHDFSGVRVHTDGRAAASARAVQATAYTVGRDIVFDSGAYAPCTTSGRSLLAHELTHVCQQSQTGTPLASTSLPIGSPDDAAESEARQMAGSVLGADVRPIGPTRMDPTPVLHREPASPDPVADAKPSPNAPFTIERWDNVETDLDIETVAALARAQILGNSKIRTWFDTELAKRGQSTTDLFSGAITVSTILMDKSATWSGAGQTRWSKVFTGAWSSTKDGKETTQPDQSIAIADSLLTDDVLDCREGDLKDAANIFVHELAHWVDAYAEGVGTTVPKESTAYDWGKYIEGLIDEKIYDAVLKAWESPK